MNATDLETAMYTMIRDFLALPKIAMPRADWVDSVGSVGSAWPHLRDYIRDYIRPESEQEINHMGETVLLSADCDGWREGVVVTLS